MLSLLIGGIAVLTAVNLGVIAILVILERAPVAPAAATSAGLRPSRRGERSPVGRC